MKPPMNIIPNRNYSKAYFWIYSKWSIDPKHKPKMNNKLNKWIWQLILLANLKEIISKKNNSLILKEFSINLAQKEYINKYKIKNMNLKINLQAKFKKFKTKKLIKMSSNRKIKIKAPKNNYKALI
jgi:hypothetical protein